MNPDAVSDTFNIGNNTETSIRELAELLISVSGTDTTIQFVPQEEIYGKSYEDIHRRVPDISRMRDRLGVVATTSLEQGLQITYDWFADQHRKRDVAPPPMPVATG